MPAVTSGRPGVFISENFAPLPAAGVVPSQAYPTIAAPHPRGPIIPTLVSSWPQFIQLYGGYTQAANSILPFAVNQFFNNGGSQLFVLRLPNSDATPCTLNLADLAGTTGGDAPLGDTGAMTVTALSPGVWADQVFIEITPVQTITTGRISINFNVYYGGSTAASLVESFPDLCMDPKDSRYAAVILNSNSQYIKVFDNVSGNTIPAGAGTSPDPYVFGSSDLLPIGPTPMTGGSDGSIAPVLSTVIPQQLAALSGFMLVLNVPGLSNVTILDALITWCAAENNFLVIDGPTPNPTAIGASIGSVPYSTWCATQYINMVTSGSPSLVPSSFAAVYAPWILVPDPSSSSGGATRWLPPGPAVLANYSTTDISSGTLETPAGTSNTIKAVALETQFSQTDLNNLNQAQVNAVKLVPGAGFCIFGGRTLALGYPDRYISIRRMIIQLETDFTNMLQNFLFEPNDTLLWQQITASMNNYLNLQMQIGALAGSTPATAYQVTCDATINTPALVVAGIVTVNVAVALSSPAEFININLSQYQGAPGSATAVTTT